MDKIFIRDKTGLELMVSGTMTFYFKTERVTVDYAAQIDLIDDGGLKAKSFITYVVHLCQLVFG